jgi:hypothetical protein
MVPKSPYGLRIGEMSASQQQFLKEWGAEFLNGIQTARLREGYTAMAVLGEADYRLYYAPFGEDVYLTAGRGTSDRSYRLPLPFRAPFSIGSTRVVMSDSISPAVESSLSERDLTRYRQPRTEQTRYSLTLGELAERVSAGGEVMLRVAPSLTAKRVTLLGSPSPGDNGGSNIRALATSLARLYNLPLTTDANGRDITLTMPETPTLGNATEMYEAVDRIMPAPLQRLYVGLAEMGKRTGLRIVRPGEGDKAARVVERFPQGVPQQIDRGLSIMQREAMRRLHTRLAPQIRDSVTHSIAWTEMDEESKWLTRFLLSDNALALVHHYSTRGTRDIFTRFAENRATVKIAPDRTWASIQVIAPEGAGMSFSRLVYLTRPK